MRKILILPVLLMALCFPSFADGNVITLDEAISSAMENNTDMEIARLELQQSIRSANNASQYIPDLTLTGSATLVGSILGNSTLDPNSWNATAGFDVSISMGLGTSMIGTTAANNAAKILANLNYAMSLSSVEQSVTTSYWNLVSAKRGMESAKTSLEAARRTYESVQDAYSAGLATSLDLSNSELEVLNYESALKQLEDAYTLSQEAFRILTGIEGDFDVTDFPQIAYLDLPTAEELYAAYGDNTNTVRMLNATVASSEAALTVQKVSNLYPSVSLSLNYNVGGDYTHRQNNPNMHETIYNDFGMNDTASATVSFSIPVGSYIPGSKGNTAVHNAEDDVAISKINLVAGRENLLSTIRSTLIKIEQSRSNIEIYTKMVDLAQRTYDLAEESYNAGLSSLSDLQKKMDSLSSAQMDLINAESEYIQNVYTLAFTLNLDYESLVTLYAEK